MISTRAKNLLKRLAFGQELTKAKRGGWWVGDRKVASCDAVELQRWCLISHRYGDLGGEVEGWEINGDGRSVLKGGRPNGDLLKVLASMGMEWRS